MIDYGCGFGALSQVSSLIPLPPFIIFTAQTTLPLFIIAYVVELYLVFCTCIVCGCCADF